MSFRHGSSLLILACLCSASGFSTSSAAQEQQATEPASPRPIRVSSGVMQGLLLHRVDPEYPSEAKQKNIQGMVVLHVLIATAGDVSEATAITGPEVLRDPAARAVAQWTYKPYLLNGKPVPVDTSVTINFSLSQ